MNKQPTIQELSEALRLRKKIDTLQRETESLQKKLDRALGAAPTGKKRAVKKAAVKKKAKKKRPQRVKKSAKKKASAPTLKDVMTQVLTQSKRPLNLDEIIEGMRKKGVKFKSKNPKHSLDVRMYTDKTFKKVKPGYFTVAR